MPDLDLLKAAKERPEDAAEVVLSVLNKVRPPDIRYSDGFKRLMAAARVQTVAEADRAYVDSIIDANAELGIAPSPGLNACREARAREKGE